MGEQNAKKAKDLFDTDVVVMQLCQIYKKVLATQ